MRPAPGSTRALGGSMRPKPYLLPLLRYSLTGQPQFNAPVQRVRSKLSGLDVFYGLSSLRWRVLWGETIMASIDVVSLTRTTLINFCKEFIQSPYLCYTEHGLHALFFAQLFDLLPAEYRYAELAGQRFCTIQKEYAMAHHLGRSRRAHWDISVIKLPLEMSQRQLAFDYLKLAAVVEFGLNCDDNHLMDDIDRVSHPSANLDSGFIAHLYRISNGFSGRDSSPKSRLLCDKTSIESVLQHRTGSPKLEVFYGIADIADPNRSGLWSITDRETTRIPAGA
jgi:hypothetical protein